MIDAETLGAWGFEIENELAIAREELANQIEALRTAQSASDAARAQQQSVQLQLSALRPPLANRLVTRLRPIDDATRAASVDVVTARNQIALTRERLADLEEAQRQVAQLLAALAPAPVEATQEQVDG